MDQSIVCDGNCFKTQSSSTTSAPISNPVVQPAIHPETLTYESIKPWQIRLLELHHGPPYAPLAGKLLTATFATQYGSQCALIRDQPVDYRCLSYTWGSLQKDCSIQLSRGSLNITANLQAALTALRDEECDIYLWVDAICIDQSDLKERAAQVSNMLYIFQAAERVEVWLGNGNDASNTAIGYLQTPVEDFRIRTMQSPASGHTKPCLEGAFELVSSLSDLYTRPWLRRSWVRQEIYAAKAITVHCGSGTLLWTAFLTGILILQAASVALGKAGFESANDVRRNQRLATDMFESTKNGGYSNKDSRDFVDVLTASQFFEASDERDKVYAVLGMCGVSIANASSANRSGLIKVDYTKQMSEIWQDVTMNLLSSTTSEEDNFVKENTPTLSQARIFPQHATSNSRFRSVFNLSGSSPAASTSIHAPSWVIDWSQIREPENISTIRSANVQGALFPYFKWGQTQAIRTPLINPDSTLKIKCWIWDVVEQVHTYSIWNLDEFIAADGLPQRWGQRTFNPARHARRAGALSIASNYTMTSGATVVLPAAAQKGDIVVVMAPDVFPLVIRPIENKGSSTSHVIQPQVVKKKKSLKSSLSGMIGPSTLGLMEAVQAMRLAPMPLRAAKDSFQTQARSAIAEKLRGQGQHCVLIGAVIGHWDRGMRIPEKGLQKVELDITLH